MQISFNKRLGIYPRISMLVGQLQRGYKDKKENILDEEDLLRYLGDIMVKSDAYELVRAVVIILGFLGGLRSNDIKELKYKGTNV